MNNLIISTWSRNDMSLLDELQRRRVSNDGPQTQLLKNFQLQEQGFHNLRTSVSNTEY
jgi:hypothetical protein